ncbi:MAG TPA: ribonuclease III [Dongiaceae bacterium]
MSGAKDKAGSFDSLAETLGHRFLRPELLAEALTHASAATRPARGGEFSNERLEFLGDRVLALVIAEMLFETFGRETEGALARRLAALTRKEALAEVGAALDLGRHLQMSRSEADGGGRSHPGMLADACEAVIGALYLDGGLPAADRMIRRCWAPLIGADSHPPQDAKTALQEWAQARGLPLPIYRVLETQGPAHSPLFNVEVRVEGWAPAAGSGRSKRAAEQEAATALLKGLQSGGDA